MRKVFSLEVSVKSNSNSFVNGVFPVGAIAFLVVRLN